MFSSWVGLWFYADLYGIKPLCENFKMTKDPPKSLPK